MSSFGAGLGGYAIVEVPIYDHNSAFNDDEFCITDFSIGDSSSDDMLVLISQESSFKKAYFIKKWVSSPWSIDYFKCKHYGNKLSVFYYRSQIAMEKATYSYTPTEIYFYFQGPTLQSTINYFEII